MDSIKLTIPVAFISERASMSWRELQFGLVNGLLDPPAVVDFAVEQVARLEHPRPPCSTSLAQIGMSQAGRASISLLLASLSVQRTRFATSGSTWCSRGYTSTAEPS
jgi:hypothetical protein